MFQYLLLGVCVIVSVNLTESCENPKDQPTVPDLISCYGYSVEIHSVTTQDGYILELHRIPGRNGSFTEKKPPVLLQHGMASNSASWVAFGPSRGLGFLLANEGYDVWLGNSRGNDYSRRHVSLSPDVFNGDYWHFSWHQMGVFDQPAVIDYILQSTGHADLIYIGHSQGNTQAFVLGSERPEYNSKIRVMVGLAPVAYFRHTKSYVFTLRLYKLLKLIPYHGELYSRNGLLTLTNRKLCRDATPLIRSECYDSMLSMYGIDREQLDKENLPVYYSFTPSSTSIDTVRHFGQVHDSGEFQQYDHGLWRNKQIYGTLKPPKYNLDNVTYPAIFYYGPNDYLCEKQDAELVFNQIANPLDFIEVPYEKFNHLDFIWAKDVKSLLYDDVIARLKPFSN